MLPLDFILYLQIIIFLFITPGTPRIVIISYSMNYGVGKCVWSALGDVTANLIQATLVIFVIGSFFLENAPTRFHTLSSNHNLLIYNSWDTTNCNHFIFNELWSR